MKHTPIPSSSLRLYFGFGTRCTQYNHASYALSSHLIQQAKSLQRSKLVLLAALFLLALRTAQVFPLTSNRIRSPLVRLVLCKRGCVFTVDAHDDSMMNKCDNNFFELYAFGRI